MKNNIFLALIMCCSTQLLANDRQVFIKNYLNDFANGKPLSHYFIEQPTFIFGPHTHTPKSAGEASQFIKTIRTKLAKINYQQSRIDTAVQHVQIDQYTLATYTLTRFKQDGSELDKICSTYGTLNTANGLKIVSWQPSDPTSDQKCE